jgi:phosphatidate cytidylyltransferase
MANKANQHLNRWITGVIALPVLIYVVGFAPRPVFYLSLLMISIVALNEFHRIISLHSNKLLCHSNYLLCLLLFTVSYLKADRFIPVVVTLWAFMPLILIVLVGAIPNKSLTDDTGKAILALIYTCLPLAMLITVDRYPDGTMWILFLLSVIFASDTGAFYVGRTFGRHKLHKTVSPGKTWEGAIGGLTGSFMAALLFFAIIAPDKLELQVFILTLILSAVGQAGDLAESLLKRNSGIKDSGKLLPGHGGLLDRIDGLLFSIPILYIYIAFFLYEVS